MGEHGFCPQGCGFAEVIGGFCEEGTPLIATEDAACSTGCSSDGAEVELGAEGSCPGEMSWLLDRAVPEEELLLVFIEVSPGTCCPECDPLQLETTTNPSSTPRTQGVTQRPVPVLAPSTLRCRMIEEITEHKALRFYQSWAKSRRCLSTS